ncbi:MAG TPA: Ig-like domain-containing protein [Archangium sp.]
MDTEAPAAPTVTGLGEEPYGDNPRPTLHGTAEAGGKVTVWLDGKEVLGTDIVVDEQGRWSFTPTSALAPAQHQLKAKVTDAVGNTSPFSEEYSFFIQKSHYGWSCTATPASPASWVLLLLVLSPGGRRRVKRFTAGV